MAKFTYYDIDHFGSVFYSYNVVKKRQKLPKVLPKEPKVVILLDSQYFE